MILEKTIQAVKDYESAVQAARRLFDDAKREIFATFNDSVATAKLAEARKAMTETETKETARALDIVSADFAEAKNKISAFVSQPVPVEFPATLAAIQAKGKSVSHFEAESYLEKYKGNYTAFGAVLSVLHGNGKAADVRIIEPDKISGDLLATERRVLLWIKNRTGGGSDSEYFARLFTTENGNPIRIVSENVENFISGGFVLDNSGRSTETE